MNLPEHVMRVLYGLLFFLLFLPVWSQDKIIEEFPEIFVRAAVEQKSVIFIFDHPNCGWCRVFDNYHASPEVKEILDPEYLIQKIDISESESGKELWEHYNFVGVPAWRIYSSDKELISDGREENRVLRRALLNCFFIAKYQLKLASFFLDRADSDLSTMHTHNMLGEAKTYASSRFTG